jgi:hypothetical protein
LCISKEDERIEILVALILEELKSDSTNCNEAFPLPKLDLFALQKPVLYHYKDVMEDVRVGAALGSGSVARYL